MAERIFVRKLEEGQWQWRVLLDENTWDSQVYHGDFSTLVEAIPSGVPVSLLLPGEQALVRTMPLENIDKKHMAKLLPYEMEEQLIDPVEELHFSFGTVEDDHVNLIYFETDTLSQSLEELVDAELDIQHIHPDYVVMQHQECHGVILLEDERVLAKFSNGRGFTIEVNVASLIFDGLQDELLGSFDGEVNIHLLANNEDDIAVLRSCLPEAWLNGAKQNSAHAEETAQALDESMQDLETEGSEDDEKVELNRTIVITEQEGSYWDAFDSILIAQPLNLRSGPFARQLPFGKWWNTWKIPSYFLAASFVFAFIVSLGNYYGAKSEGKDIRLEMQQVYLQALPKGRLGDEENRLKSKLKGKNTKVSEPSNLMVLLSGLASSMTQHKDIKLSNFRYNGEQRELQVNLEVKSLKAVNDFRTMLESYGLASGSPRTSKIRDIYQASMKITEKK